MDLYTSLTRLKMAMNDGHLPPMTSLGEEARRFLDPAFTPGMGALEEDETKGLRCPVRGCGQYFHRLAQHIALRHRNIGGVAAVRSALSLPKSVPLSTKAERNRIAAVRAGSPGWRAHLAAIRPTEHPLHDADIRARRSETISRDRLSVNSRNLRDRCDAQMRNRFVDLHNKIGRSPTLREVREEYGQTFARYVTLCYGNWENARNQLGMEAVRARGNHRISRQTALDALAAWHGAHGEFPAVREVKNSDTAPLMPGTKAIMSALGAGRSWTLAMQIAASLLNIYGGRYGLPERAA